MLGGVANVTGDRVELSCKSHLWQGGAVMLTHLQYEWQPSRQGPAPLLIQIWNVWHAGVWRGSRAVCLLESCFCHWSSAPTEEVRSASPCGQQPSPTHLQKIKLNIQSLGMLLTWFLRSQSEMVFKFSNSLFIIIWSNSNFNCSLLQPTLILCLLCISAQSRDSYIV